MANVIKYLKICSSKLVWYDQFLTRRSPGWRFEKSPEMKLYQKYEVSKHSASLIRDKVSAMLMMSKKQWVYCKLEKKWFQFQLNFITLTLSSPQFTTDTDVKEKLLNTFLTRLRQDYGVTQYIWRAEAQGNGRIHFHILINKYIHWSKVREMWNIIQKNNGYLDNFYQNYHHYNPNSTDIHSIKRIRNLGAYLSKYMSKEQADDVKPDLVETEIYKNGIYNVETRRRLIIGRIWGCSYFLSNLKGLILECYGVVDDESRRIWEKVKLLNPNPYVTMVFISPSEWKKIAPTLWERFKKYIWEIFDNTEVIANFNNVN